MTVDCKAFQEHLAAAVSAARTLDEIEAWFNSQECIGSVQLAGYLLKSNPPQRDFIIEFKDVDGSIVKKIANIFDLGNQQFRFNKLRDE